MSDMNSDQLEANNMVYELAILCVILDVIISNNVEALKKTSLKEYNVEYKELDDHTMVTDSNVFPYVVAILEKLSYVSAGALIHEDWVLTAAESLFLVRESSRTFRVRLGSINYKRGGILLPIKYFEIHPNFDDSKPEFDIALVKLPQPVRFTPKLYPIRMQRRRRQVSATHFIVTAWPSTPLLNRDGLYRIHSMEVIKRRRILSVHHLHPTDHENCAADLNSINVNDTETIMCLDPTPGSDPCVRDVGAPVVLNSILWGIVSSWRPQYCDSDISPTFVTLLSGKGVGSWIYARMRGQKWNTSEKRYEEQESLFEFDYDDAVYF